MSTTCVLLLKNIANIGSVGETANVRLGYATNFLIPKKLVVYFSSKNIKCLNYQKKIIKNNVKLMKENNELLFKKLQSIEITIKVKTSNKGRLFGAITPKDISSLLAKKGIVINLKNIHIRKIIKKIGIHSVNITLGPTLNINLDIVVVSKSI